MPSFECPCMHRVYGVRNTNGITYRRTPVPFLLSLRTMSSEEGTTAINTQACARVVPVNFKPASGIEVRQYHPYTTKYSRVYVSFLGSCLRRPSNSTDVLSLFLVSSLDVWLEQAVKEKETKSDLTYLSVFLQVFDGVYLGKMLGAGVQAKVFDLVHKDGSPTGKVLKIGHQDFGHSLFLNTMATSMMSLQREWEIGMQLKAALEDAEGNLPGFTRTCDCMAIMKDKAHAVTFRGMMMEKIQGWSVASRITDPSFHNIHYIREMLYQVFSALDRAQRYLGFNHADLGLNNVMEHYPEIQSSLKEKQKTENLHAMRLNRTISDADGDATPKTPGKEPSWSRPEYGCVVPPPIPGYSCTLDGQKLPLGPNIEFKIIDYGVGEFNTTLAQAAGGYTADETLRRIHEVFSQRGIPVGENASDDLLRLVEAHESQKQVKKQNSNRGMLLKREKDNRFVVVVESEKKGSKEKIKKQPTTTSVSRGVIEKMYRNFWERKGDVFHLLLSLAVTLDDRVWPKEDEKDVQLFISLVHHVTGVKMKAYFVSPEDSKRIKVMGRRLKVHEEASVIDGYTPNLYGARVRLFNKMRKFRMVLSAHFKPFNSGLLAGEALVSPFFGSQGPPHAKLPVCVQSAFPFKSS